MTGIPADEVQAIIDEMEQQNIMLRARAVSHVRALFALRQENDTLRKAIAELKAAAEQNATVSRRKPSADH